jgi:capsular exopolysaccharide synthesis family protein
VTEPRQEGLDFRQWWGLIRRRKWLLLAIVVVIPTAVYFVSSRLPKTYEAKATVKVLPTGAMSSVFSGITPKAEIVEVPTLIRTTVVTRRAARLLNRPPSAGKGLLGHVTVGPANPNESGGNFLAVTATAADSNEAADIANAFALALKQVRTTTAVAEINHTIRTLEAQTESSKGSEGSLAKEFQQLRLLKASQSNTTQIVEEASPPATPTSPRPKRNAVMALILSLLIAAALAPLLDRFDRRIREPGELEDILEAPVLAVVSDDAFPGHPPNYHVREAFETLRSSLTYFNVDRTLSSLVIASPIPQDGKTTVAINLAIAYALDERDVILIDGDMRRPQVAARLGKEVSVGLESVLVGESKLDDALSYVDVGAGRLRILPGAVPPPNPAVLLGSQRMRMLLAELSEQVDIVIVDTPGLLACSDAIPLFSQVSGSVIVARMNRTPQDVLRRTKQVITSAGGSVLGSVVTGARTGGIYGYYSYYGYYDGGPDGTNGAEAPNGLRRLRNFGSSGFRRSRD